MSHETIDPRLTHQLAEFKHEIPLTTCRLDPSGRYAVAGAEDLTVCRWDLESGAKTVLTGHESWVRSMDFSADGGTLYTAGWDGQVGWWETAAEQPQPTRMMQAHRGFARWVRRSPCGRMLATCGNDLLVCVWDEQTGEQIAELAGHGRHPYAVDFHPSLPQLVSQDLMGQVLVWDLATASQSAEIDASVMTGYDNKFAADMGGARDMAFRGDGLVLATAGITKVVNAFAGVQDPLTVLIDWPSKRITHHLRQTTTAQGIAWGVRFHPHGFVIGAVARQNGKGELNFWQPWPLTPPVEDLTQAEAELAATLRGDGSAAAAKQAPAKPGEPAKPIELKPFHTLELAKCARAVDLSADGRRLAVAHSDGALRIYQMTAKAPAKAKAAGDAAVAPKK